MWTQSAWRLPTTYNGPYAGRDKSDIIVYSAFIRAARDGHFAPFCSKFVPELGAPFTANWNDWPFLEYVPLYLIGVLARAVGIFAALNIALLTWHLLAGITFYLVARYRKIDIVWSFTTALAFGLASFIFSQSPDHPMVALCWHVPLFLVVWGWLSDEAGIQRQSKRFWFGIAIGFIAGLQNPYYSATFCQLVVLTAAAMFIRTRKPNHLISGLWFLAATASAFVLININPWLYSLRFGRSQGAVVRQFQWLEIYALKLLDLFVPPLNHLWETFRNFAQWRAQVAILHDEGSYLGIIGAAALLLLVTSAIHTAIKRNSLRVPTAAWQVLWIFAFYTTGGLNAIVGALGFTYLRAGCRLSIVILAVSLLFAAEWLARRRDRLLILSSLAAGACCLVVLLDQVPLPPSQDEKVMIARQISSDEKFVADTESALPHGAMVFQLPVMDFPEAPLRTVSSYDHLRPYLYTRYLRFSFGSMKGRPREQWQHDLEKMSLPDAINEVKERGFSALYVSRIGYPDGAHELEQNLRALGYNEIIQSAEGDLFCVRLDSKSF
jgi:phosphoglycerol transferase